MREVCTTCGGPRGPVRLPVVPGLACETCYRTLTAEQLAAGVAATPAFDLRNTVIPPGSTIEWLPVGSEEMWTASTVVADCGSRVQVQRGVEVPRGRILAVYVPQRLPDTSAC